MDSVTIAPIRIKYLGLSEYEPVWRAMQGFTDERTKQTNDELWVVEHPPVFTQGQAGKAEHILNAGDIPIIQLAESFDYCQAQSRAFCCY